jgi:sugar lactone lactonase YvrE
MRPAHALIVSLLLGTAAMAQGQEYVISTVAGGSVLPLTPVPGVNMSLSSLKSVAADSTGNTYFVASNLVFRLDQNGIVTRIAGNGQPGYSGDGGPATSAQLQLESVALAPPLSYYVDPPPPGIAVDNSGNVYVADIGNYRVRKISPDGIITTVAGSGTAGFSGDGGPAISAQLSGVAGLAIDAAGNLLIADFSANRIRRVAADGSIATVAGTGDCGFAGDGGAAAMAQICNPTGIALDNAGNLFITNLGNNRIRRISPDGSITTVAATGTATSVVVDQAGNLYVNDAETDGWWIWQLVKKISPSGTITTVAGLPCSGFPMQPPCGADGTTATKTFLGGPLSLAVDNTGNLLVADGGDGSKERISKVSSAGAITTMVGSCGGLPELDPPDCQMPFLGDGGPAIAVQLGPAGVAVDGEGNLFISSNSRIRKVSTDGIITTLAGNGTFGSAGDGGPAANAQMEPYRLTLDGAGNLFFFDIPNRNIRKISPDGIISTVTVVHGNDYFVALDRASDLFIADPTNTLYAIAEVSPSGSIRRVAGGACGIYPCSGFLGDGGPATSAELSGAQGVAVDAAGNIFIADSQDHRIRKVTPDGIITTVAGNSPLPGPGGFSGDGGPAVDAQLNYPIDVAVDGTGNLYIADYENQRIRRVSPDGIINTIAGNGTPGYSGDGGPATSASLTRPSALAVDGAGNIYVVDNAAIRVLRPVPPHGGTPLDGRGAR